MNDAMLNTILGLLLQCSYTVAAKCPSPLPINTLVGGVAKDGVIPYNRAGQLYSNVLRPQVGGRFAASWSLFKASQIQQHGLWCQVRDEDNAGMGSNIGDFYYPTGDGPNDFTLTPTSASNSAPYVSLKCTNQIALVVDGDVTNNQGIVTCNSTIPNLDRDANYWVVYSDTLYNNYNGPVVDSTMTPSVLSSRDTAPNINISFTFNVTFGPPSRIGCFYGNEEIFTIRGFESPRLVTYEVIRPHYINSSVPDMTRVTVRLPPQPREERTFTCTVTVEGRTDIQSGPYNFDIKGTGSSTATLTVAGTPTGVTVSRNALTSAKVSWTAPSLAPAGYEVFYQVTGGGSRISGGNISNTELTLTGLTLGETYSMFVVAYGAEGAPVLPSAHSNTTTIILSTPQLTATTLIPTSSSIMVSWTAPQFAPNSFSISYFCQRLCGSPPTQGTKILHNGETIDYTLTQIPSSAICNISVVAVFGSNKNSNTVTSSTNTKPAAPNDVPKGSKVMTVGRRSLSVVWGTVSCPNQRGPITGYRLHYTDNDKTYTINITGEGSRQHLLTGLTPFTNYSVQVAAVNDGGTGPYSTPLIVETLQDVPGQISALSAKPEVLQLKLSWISPSEPNGRIVAYQIGYSTGQGFDYTNTSATQHTLKGFRPNTVVTFSVTAYTIIGPGESVTAEANTGKIPHATGVQVQILNATAVSVSWTPVNLSVVDHYTIHYTLLRRGRQSGSGIVNITAGSSSGVVGGLMTGEQYQFSVSVTVSGGGQYYTGPVSDPTDPVTVADTINSALPITGAVVGIIVVLVIVMVVAVVVVVMVLRVQKHSRKFSYSTDDSVYYEKYDCRHGETVARVDVIKPSIDQFPESQTVDEGKMVVFPVQVSGSPPPSILWYHDSIQLKNDSAHGIADNGSLTIYVTEMKHAGMYRMVVTNISGSVEQQLILTIGEATNPELLSDKLRGQVPASSSQKTKGGYHVSQFREFVTQNHANTNKGFKALYSSLETGELEHPVTVAFTPGNKPLNRFTNITVYDDNRIVLQPIRGRSDCQNDYINACYIDGYSLPNKYIASQAPLNRTTVDFWRMIWQERPPVIVMVTNLKEGNKTKCQQYWPDTESHDYGPFRVTTIEQQVYSDYVIRKLKLKLPVLSQEVLSITQYHFTSWPDHGVPEYATPILAFYRRIKQEHSSSIPILVHCSAGVGRTGTFITLDIALEQVKRDDVVDISGVINKMRHMRMKMVQNQDQFVFLHDAILEYVVCGNTQINAGDLRSAIHLMQNIGPASGKTKFEVQFEVLSEQTADPQQVRREVALQYPEKNRSMEFLPPDRNRVILKGEHPDYVHATYINGYKHRKAFVIAQNPMENTVRDFLKMLVDRNCGAVVMIGAEDEQNACFQYWHTQDREVHNDVSVKLISEESYHGYMERCLTITLQSTTDPNQFTHHEVTQFHILNWNVQGKCSEVLIITNVIEEMYRVQRRTGNNPVVVHCSDTVSRSGMFCAIATTIDQCKTEGVVDVFQVVKAQRIQKPGLVLTVEQYQFIFKAMMSFLDSFDSYSNFQ